MIFKKMLKNSVNIRILGVICVRFYFKSTKIISEQILTQASVRYQITE